MQNVFVFLIYILIISHVSVQFIGQGLTIMNIFKKVQFLFELLLKIFFYLSLSDGGRVNLF